jgi:hypothetical protein
LSHEYVRPTGRPPGSKPIHLLYGAVLLVVWVVVLVWVLTRGQGDQSSVDVYSQLPPAFTNELAAKGVLYQGLSPVDSATTEQAVSHAAAEGVVANGANAIVLRTALSDQAKGYTDQPSLMVVVPGATVPGGGPGVFVAFLDPTTYRTLTTLSYSTSGSSPAPSASASG